MLCSFKLNRKRKNVFCLKRLYIGINLLLENNLVFKSIMDGVNVFYEFLIYIWKLIKWNKEGKEGIVFCILIILIDLYMMGKRCNVFCFGIVINKKIKFFF